jgi:DNA-binding NarL/FixJ family response regulator
MFPDGKLFVRPGLCFQFLFNPSPNQPYIMTSILIFDYPVVSYGIRMFVKDFFPGRSILHAATLEEATAHIRNDGVGLVVMDISIRIERDMDIIDLFRELKNDICILIFTEKNKKKYGDLYLNAGADGFLTKRSSNEEYQAVVNHILGSNQCAGDDIVSEPNHPA